MDALQLSKKEVLDQTSSAKEQLNTVLEEIKVLREDVKQKIGEGLNGLSAAAKRIAAGVIHELDEFHGQLHTSYSSLGRDFKSIFEELVKHLEGQRAESQALRQELDEALQAKSMAEEELSSRLKDTLREQQVQATTDRQQLLSQISALIESSGKGRIDGGRQRLAQSRRILKVQGIH